MVVDFRAETTSSVNFKVKLSDGINMVEAIEFGPYSIGALDSSINTSLQNDLQSWCTANWGIVFNVLNNDMVKLLNKPISV